MENASYTNSTKLVKEGNCVDANLASLRSPTTPEAVTKVNSECNVVGNKFLNLINEESHHSKWDELRKLATDGVSEECSNLLKRMELADSDDEYELLDDEGGELPEAGEALALADLGMDTAMVSEVEEGKRNQKRKTKWGPTERIPRPRRVPDDGKTSSKSTGAENDSESRER